MIKYFASFKIYKITSEKREYIGGFSVNNVDLSAIRKLQSVIMKRASEKEKSNA